MSVASAGGCGATAPFDALVAALDALACGAGGGTPDLGAVGALLVALAGSPLLADAASADLWRADGYQRHRLATAPRSGAVVYAMAWLPGQTTPIHNHGCWGAVCVALGALRETHYALTSNGWAQPVGSRIFSAGEVLAFADGAAAIHACEAAGAERALSVHVYGRDDALLRSFEATDG